MYRRSRVYYCIFINRRRDKGGSWTRRSFATSHYLAARLTRVQWSVELIKLITRYNRHYVITRRVFWFIGTWDWSRGWHPARSKGAASTRRRRSPARVWSVRRAPKRTVRTRTWPPSSRQYAPARHPSCRYLPRSGPRGPRGRSFSLSFSRINARRSTRLIRFAGPTTACRTSAFGRPKFFVDSLLRKLATAASPLRNKWINVSWLVALGIIRGITVELQGSCPRLR